MEFQKQKYAEIIKNAIVQFAALIEPKYLPEHFFKVLAPNINPNFIEDKSLLTNERIRDYIDWDKLDKMKLIRLIVRDKYVLERIDLNKHDFALRDLIPVFIVHPDLIEYFEIDYDDLSSIDAISLLKINRNFIEKVDIGKYDYSKKEIESIIDYFHNEPRIIEKLNLTVLDHYAIRMLLKKSGDKYLIKDERLNTYNIDITKLKDLDWLDILKSKPELISYCNLDLFKVNDCFSLVKLVQILPHYDYVIEENKEKISALGWETLLSFNPDLYSKYCDFEKLTKKNWENVIYKHPALTNLMKRYVLV